MLCKLTTFAIGALSLEAFVSGIILCVAMCEEGMNPVGAVSISCF